MTDEDAQVEAARSAKSPHRVALRWAYAVMETEMGTAWDLSHPDFLLACAQAWTLMLETPPAGHRDAFVAKLVDGNAVASEAFLAFSWWLRDTWKEILAPVAGPRLGVQATSHLVGANLELVVLDTGRDPSRVPRATLMIALAMSAGGWRLADSEHRTHALATRMATYQNCAR